MTSTPSSIVTELEAVLADAKAVVPALEAVVSVAEKIKPLLPAADQAFVTDGVGILTGLISVLSKA